MYKRADIKGYDGFYQIDTDGNVYSCRKTGKIKNRLAEPKVMKQGTHPFGHKLIALSKNNKPKYYYVHRLILETFVGPCPKGKQCRHLDNNPANNRLSNIEWATVSVNQMDRVINKTSNRGERCGSSKLNKFQVLKIRKKYKTGKYTMQRLADSYGINISTTWQIIHKEIWGHV